MVAIVFDSFRHARVVTKTSKVLAWLAIIVANLFFVYFALLKGMARDSHWQTGYVTACILQLCVEIFLYETSECVWIHFAIPQLVSKDIEHTVHELKKSVNIAFSVTGGAGVALDAPSFLFVSTRVAKKFSHLFECAVVLAYHTYNPGRVAEKWLTQKGARKATEAATRGGPRQSSNTLRRFSIFASLVYIMLQIGTLPIRLQKLVIHSVQPITVAVIIVVLRFLWRYPYCFAVPLVILVIEVLRRRKGVREDRDMNQTNPSPGEQPNLSRKESGVVSSLSAIEPEIIKKTNDGSKEITKNRLDSNESGNVVVATLGSSNRVNFALPGEMGSSSDGPGSQVLRVVPEEHSHASDSSDDEKIDDGWGRKGKQTMQWKKHVRGIFDYSSSSSSNADESDEVERDIYSVSSYSNSEESNEGDYDSDLEAMETIAMPMEQNGRRKVRGEGKAEQDDSGSSGSDIEIMVVRGAETVVCRL